MELQLTGNLRVFRDEIRQFLRDNYPADLMRKGHEGRRWARDDYVAWQRILNDHGMGGPGWPVEYGGTGWSPMQRYIFDTECAFAGTPREIPFGLRMVGPVIMAYGTPAQQARFLPKILSLEHWWAQGYSEPNAGSDLASLRTAAVRDGDHYVVNGAKIWTTFAQHANWMFCLVRTRHDVKPQRGISFLLIDMDTPGVTVRPIRTIDGEDELNEVLFDEVRVPADQLIGEENSGWTYAKYLLQHERTDIARVGRAKAAMQRLVEAATRHPGTGAGPLIEDVHFRHRLSSLRMRLLNLEVLNLKTLSAAETSAGNISPVDASILKVMSSQVHQDIAELSMRALGRLGLYAHSPGDPADPAMQSLPWYRPSDETFTNTYLNMRKTSIYGGANEVQKNIIAQLLGL